MTQGTHPGRRSRLRPVAGVLLLIFLLPVALYLLGGYFLLPGIIERQLPRLLAERLERQLQVRRVRFDPLHLSLALDGVELREADGTLLLSFQRLSADVSLQQLLKRRLQFDRVLLQGPWLHLQWDRQGRLNLQRLIDDAMALGNAPPAQRSQADETPLPLTLARVSIENGQLVISDHRGQHSASATLVPIQLDLERIALDSGGRGDMRLVIGLPGAQGRFLWEGDLGLSPLRSDGRLSLEGFQPFRVWQFLEDELAIQPPDGTLGLDARYRFALEHDGPRLQMERITLQGERLGMTRKGSATPLLTLKQLRLSGGRYDLAGNRFSVETLRLSGGSVRIVRHHTLFDWARIAEKAVASSAPEKRPPAQVGPPLPWQLQLQRLQVDDLGVTFLDRDLVRPLTARIDAVDLALTLRAGQEQGRLQAEVSALQSRLAGLSLQQQGRKSPLLRIGRIALSGGTGSLGGRSLALQRLQIDGGDTRLVRDSDGTLEWRRLLQPKRPPGAGGEDSGKPPREEPWRVTVDATSLRNFRVHLADRVPQRPLQLDLTPLSISLSRLSSTMQAPVTFSIASGVRPGGSLELSGKVAPEGPAVEAKIKLSALPLAPLQSYIEPLLKAVLKSGSLSLSGALSFSGKENNAVRFDGSAGIQGLKLVEADGGETLLGWQSLQVPRLTFGLQPDELKIDELLLRQPMGKFILAEDKSNNWQDLLKRKTGGGRAMAPPSSSDPGQPFPVTLNRIRLEQGSLHFADLGLPLKFSTRIHRLEGVIAGLSSDPGARAVADLNGRVAEFGAVTIKGELEPFQPLDFTDIEMQFKNLEMTDLTPYTVKFLGYRIASGKLSLDLKYRIEKQKLQGENSILLDHLTLGEKVESPDAIDAPLELAIALLQDSDGRIDLGLPVSGDLNDPQFSYGQIVWKAVGNLITGIVTAPFRALGAAFGVKGENLDLLPFAPGSATLEPASEEKLKTVSDILAKRPRLVLQVLPRFDPKLDRDALARRKLQIELLRQMGVKVEQGRRPDPISLSDRRVRKALEARYLQTFAASKLAEMKKKSGKNGEETLYQTMYRQLLARQQISRDALMRLGTERGEVTVRQLTENFKLPKQRIELLDPVPVAAASGTEQATTVATRLELTAR